jgi:hypothetical protein
MAMKRLWLCLPVLGLGLPLIIYLVVGLGAQPAVDSTPDPPTPLVKDQAGALPGAAGMEKLARKDPVAFLEDCVRRYRREVKGYHCIMQKQERIGGRLNPREVIEVDFRQKPFSVYLRWIEGARQAASAVYVQGENDGQMLVYPKGLGSVLGVLALDVDGTRARQSGRYTLDQFGIEKGMLRTLATWEAAQKRDELGVKYRGERVVKEAGDRASYWLERNYDKPEHDGVMHLTVYIDKKNWLQVGSLVKDKDGKLIGEYYFRDIKLNPMFKKEQFTRAALAP